MSKITVAYFSASGVTRAVAQRLAQATGAELFEIEPKVKYTDADLNWMDKKSRSSIEMADRSSRPGIVAYPDLSCCDTVLVGFPVWWYREPSVIDTFLEGCDFTGKRLIPFCTSGTSGLGESTDNFRKLAPGAVVTEGKRFAAGVSESELKAWYDSLK